jgi:hypothetical protein
VLKGPGRPATSHSLTYAADSREVLTESLSKTLPWGDTKLSDENAQPFACIGFVEGPLRWPVSGKVHRAMYSDFTRRFGILCGQEQRAGRIDLRFTALQD